MSWRKKLRAHNSQRMIAIFRAIKLRMSLFEGGGGPIFRRVVFTGFWWGNLRERYHFEDASVDGRKILRLIGNWFVGAWT